MIHLYVLSSATNALTTHIYQLENGVKRWIVDIPTFAAQGCQWAGVQIMSCFSLSTTLMGETIPPGRGPTPEP